MGKEKAKGKPKAGASKLGGGFLWAGAQWGVEWFLYPPGHPLAGSLWTAFAAAFGGFIAGWVTVGLLNRLGKWGVGPLALLAFGALIGAVVASGAVKGLSTLFSWWFAAKPPSIDWEGLKTFVLSWRVAPALALGALSGLYVKTKTGK